MALFDIHEVITLFKKFYVSCHDGVLRTPSINDSRFKPIRSWLRSEKASCPDLRTKTEIEILETALTDLGLDGTDLIAIPGSELADNLCGWARVFFPALEPCTDIEILAYWHEIGERIDYALAQKNGDPVKSPIEPIDLLSYWTLLNATAVREQVRQDHAIPQAL